MNRSPNPDARQPASQPASQPATRKNVNSTSYLFAQVGVVVFLYSLEVWELGEERFTEVLIGANKMKEYQPAISPRRSLLSFWAALTFSSASHFLFSAFSASFLAHSKFSFSEEIWMFSRASVCSNFCVSSFFSCVSWAWHKGTRKMLLNW